MFKKWMLYVLMDQAGEGGAAGGGSGVDGAQAAGATGAAAAATSGTQEGGTASLNPLQAAAAAAPAIIPEKFQVKNEDGTVNHEATALKISEAYSAAEKRIGSGDIPPKTAAEYAIAVPKALEGAWDPAADPQLKTFTEKAHGLHFTQAQMDLVIETYGEIAPGLVAGSVALSAEECTATLKEVWKNPGEYEAETQAAGRTLKAYGGEKVEDFLARYGNDPDLIQMLAKIGHEVAEDKPLDPGEVLQGKTIGELEASEAYRNPADPQHAAVSKQVRDYYEAKTKAEAAAGKGILF